MKKANKALTVLANNPILSDTLTFGGIIFATVGNIMILYGSFFRGLNKGVETRDNYYYEKEMTDYEKTGE